MFDTKDKTRTAYKILTKAVDGLLDKDPFFGHLSDSTALIADEKHEHLKTIGTNGQVIVYNPDWVVKQYNEWTTGYGEAKANSFMRTVMAHECGHIAALHPFRRRDRDESRWNMACDGVLNDILRARGYDMPPDSFVWPDGRKLTADELYRLLEQQGQGGKSDGRQQRWGGVMDPDKGPDKDGKPQQGEGDGEGHGMSQHEFGEAEDNAREATAQAAQKAKEAGNMPGSYEGLIKEADIPQRDWRDTLRKFLGGGNERDQSWSRPNRRFIGSGDYLPGFAKYGPGEVVLAIDTSGSVNDQLLGKFMAEVRKINEDIQPEKIHVVCCDCVVQWTDTFGPFDDVKAVAKGRGGTAFSPVFNWVKEREIEPKALIYFTDLECSDYGKADYPVLWVVWPGGSSRNPPFGEVIRMD